LASASIGADRALGKGAVSLIASPLVCADALVSLDPV
jgi:hypothetical protein